MKNTLELHLFSKFVWRVFVICLIRFERPYIFDERLKNQSVHDPQMLKAMKRSALLACAEHTIPAESKIADNKCEIDLDELHTRRKFQRPC